MDFRKRCQDYSVGKHSPFNEWMVLWQPDMHKQKNETGPLTNINAKWINDLNRRAKTIKALEENIVGWIYVTLSLAMDS